MNSPAASLSPNYLRSRIGKVCVAITGDDAGELLERAQALYRDNSFLEFRLDYLVKPLAALPKLKAFLAEHPEITAIATCRREANGGKFAGNNAAELEVLQKAAAAGFHLVDVELQTAEQVKPQELDKLRQRGAALILSYHDFMTTKDLDGIFERMRPLEPEFIKIVSTARHLADNVAMIRFLERARDKANVIGICMGEQGVMSRILGPRSGSVFTFASVATGEEMRRDRFPRARCSTSTASTSSTSRPRFMAWPAIRWRIRSRLRCSMRRFGGSGSTPSICRCRPRG